MKCFHLMLVGFVGVTGVRVTLDEADVGGRPDVAIEKVSTLELGLGLGFDTNDVQFVAGKLLQYVSDNNSWSQCNPPWVHCPMLQGGVLLVMSKKPEPNKLLRRPINRYSIYAWIQIFQKSIRSQQ